MRQPSRNSLNITTDVEPFATPASLESAIADDAALPDEAPLPDWRELGRRVLSEAMRRTARELRRRNGCTTYIDRTRTSPEGNS